ncbi:hypothetical protein E2C01_034738 [Portunus trituberculatus]|uniref:Uncharacterized protein n=1 Tax=Portunus trituberculatus TaxID=210409 RepID=A0A5B7F7T7_PORTR|nr:hypothetical protein [Portunus trituberculatus]
MGSMRRGDGGKRVDEPPSVDIHEKVVESQQIRTDDGLRDFPDVKSPVKRAAESEVDFFFASRIDGYLGTVGGIEVQDRRKVSLSRLGRKNTDVRASVDEEANTRAVVTDVEQRGRLLVGRVLHHCSPLAFDNLVQGAVHFRAFLPNFWWYQHNPGLLERGRCWRRRRLADRDRGRSRSCCLR